ncbi:amidohydrolase family protein [Oscillibacter sp. 1-3]|uniref:metal-dependent hydrolase family protein n=1 Tax=Oscillibacter sp. 1-3 TaxID=1235797 RepID=UPI00033A0030|nr:amidohydrolase family protein [Oscillibacter sp. 1-3]EOS65024.1 hypothetical protein C816_02752 [Oscillibacter sp. 1-3]
MILLKNCRLIPELVEGFSENRADIVIDDTSILNIAPAGKIHSFNGQIIDVMGSTVLPGFFDLHTHLYMTELNMLLLDNKNEVDTCFDTYAFSREYLRQGYTTLRDAGCPFHVTRGLMKARKRGIINVPDIITAGHALTPTESGNDEYKHLYEVADGPDEFRKAARKQLEAGNDIIKVMVTGAFLNESGDPGQTIIAEDELRSIVDVARRKGTYVMGHAHGADGIKLAIRCGLRTIEHGCFIDSEGIAMLKDRDDCFMIPTGTVSIASTDENMNALVDGASEKSHIYEEQEKACVNAAYRAGLKMGFGSDADYANFKRRPGLEFIARTDWYDFSYLDILLQATKNSAEIAGMADRKGTIKVGKASELVVIEGNPDEDIYVMRKKPRYVFFRGEIIEN